MRAEDYPYFDAPFCAFAHRGGPLLPGNVGRENSLHAFGQAVGLGYRYLETDVHVTADGVLIAFHDDRLDRATDGTGLIAELPWSEVQQARIGGLEPIPTMDEVFETFPDSRFNIDLKAAGAVAPLADAIASHRAQNRVCVTSFGPDRLNAFRRRMGTQVATGTSRTEVAWTRFVPFLPRLRPAPGVVLQVPVTSTIAGREVRIVTPGFIRTAHDTGRQVHVWTIDEPHQMHALLDMGVDGLISDRIDVLREVLVERGLWW
ncbi:glycerophosphodiester phosphodiesterase [Enemella sp. A6]|uniref:glycerophosphodiester phosphodiesterase n=1 Tax=Enemella sp. A6 TaxID=3440152 RepID=UPI003EBDEA0B